MTIKHIFAIGILSVLSACVSAQDSFIKSFNPGSYQQILRENAAHPFILAIWSLDCPSCIKDMRILSEVKQKYPELKIILLSTDEPSAVPEVKAMLTKQNLADTENWIFGSDDAQKLRFEIDSSWFGELPRTYFFDQTHNRIGKSGALRLDEFEAHIDRIKP